MAGHSAAQQGRWLPDDWPPDKGSGWGICALSLPLEAQQGPAVFSEPLFQRSVPLQQLQAWY